MFPEDTVTKAIRDEIAESVANRPTPLEPWEAAVDSLVMINVAIRVEEELGIELPDDVMPAGGFDDVEQCVEIVLQKCKELWTVSVPATEEA